MDNITELIDQLKQRAVEKNDEGYMPAITGLRLLLKSNATLKAENAELKEQVEQLEIRRKIFTRKGQTALLKELADLRQRRKVPQELVAVLETLGRADNEATACPYWLIIDPCQMMSPSFSRVGSMITGPFFCREDAEHWLKEIRPHAFSKRAGVYCCSGHWSNKYKTFVESARKLIAEQEGDK